MPATLDGVTYPDFVRADGASYTGLPDLGRPGEPTVTPLMTDMKYNAIKGGLEQSGSLSYLADDYSKAQSAARAAKQPFDGDAFLKKHPDYKTAKPTLEELQVKHGATMDNITAVNADRRLGENLQRGKVRAVNVHGMPTLPDARNIAQAEKVMRGTMEAHAPKGPEVKPTTPRATGSFAGKGPAAARVAGAVLAVGMAVHSGASNAKEVAVAVTPGAAATRDRGLCHGFAEVAGVGSGVVAGGAVTVLGAPVLTPAGSAVLGVGTGIATEQAVTAVGEYACDTIVPKIADAGRTAANWVKNTLSF